MTPGIITGCKLPKNADAIPPITEWTIMVTGAITMDDITIIMKIPQELHP
jgi:hypothetical protein